MGRTPLTDRIVEIRACAPEQIARTLAERPRGRIPGGGAKLLVIGNYPPNDIFLSHNCVFQSHKITTVFCMI